MEGCNHILGGEYLRKLVSSDGKILSNNFLRRVGPSRMVCVIIYLSVYHLDLDFYFIKL